MRRRASLIQLMALVVVIAVGLAAIKRATAGAAQLAVVVAAVTLLVGTLGAIVRRPRAGWIGFALFGWFYALVLIGVPIVAALAPLIANEMYEFWLIDIPVREAVAWIHPPPPYPADLPSADNLTRRQGKYYGSGVEVQISPEEIKAVAAYFDQIDHYEDWSRTLMRAQRVAFPFQGIIFALIGATIGQALEGTGRGESLAVRTGTESRP